MTAGNANAVVVFFICTETGKLNVLTLPAICRIRLLRLRSMTKPDDINEHDILVERAVRWLKGTYGCGVAVPELVTYASESPDAVGWRDQGQSTVMIECKVSRSDFHSDKRKRFRKHPERGVGHFRYYMSYEGIIGAEDLPPSWGLLIVRGKTVRQIVKAERQAQNDAANLIMMYSLLRRTDLRGRLRECLSEKWGGVNPSAALEAAGEEG